MKKLFKFFALLLVCMSASGAIADVNSEIYAELALIELNYSEVCVDVTSTNKLIQLGEPAVDALAEVLLSDEFGRKSKWSAAMALGEIGSIDALSALSAVDKKFGPNSEEFWLGKLARKAIEKIGAPELKAGKFYVYSVGVETVRKDCETGELKVIREQ